MFYKKANRTIEEDLACFNRERFRNKRLNKLIESRDVIPRPLVRLFKKVEKLYKNAIDEFSYVDWRHEYELRGRVQYDNMGSPIYCEGDKPNCSYCKRAEKDMEKAAKLAAEGMRLLKKGEYHDGAGYITDAFRIEAEYGDTPAYRPLTRAVDELVDKWDDYEEAHWDD